MVPTLIRTRHTGADYPDVLFPLGETHHQQPIPLRMPDKDLTDLLVGMVEVREDRGQRVYKGGRRLGERHPIFAEVGFGLGLVPLEFHSYHHAQRLRSQYHRVSN